MSKNRRYELKLVGSHRVEEPRVGKVKHDSRGNAVWDWAINTDVLSKKSSTELLKSLEEPKLTLEGETDIATAWQGDPYNRTAR